MDAFVSVLLFYSLIGTVNGLIFGFATRAVVYNKGYSENWFWYGFFFGFIATIVALTKPDMHAYSNTRGTIDAPPTLQVEPRKLSSEKIGPNQWRCSCGMVNMEYTGTCSCGRKKWQAKEEIEQKRQKLRDRIAAEKASAPSGTPAKVANIEKTDDLPLIIRSYDPGSALKLLSVNLERPNGEYVDAEIKYKLYSDNISAARVDFIFVDLWGDKILLSDLDISFSPETGKSGFVKLLFRLSPEKISSIRSVFANIKRLLVNGEPRNLSGESKEISIPDQELRSLRSRVGDDAVTQGAITDKDWTCFCGTVNEKSADTCSLCHRKSEAIK